MSQQFLLFTSLALLRRFLSSPLLLRFWRFDFAQLFQAVGDGEGSVGFALLADAGGPEGVGKVGPVVVAFV